MFHPMALAVVLALVAAIILSITFVPAAVALWVKGDIQKRKSLDVMAKAKYQQTLDISYQHKAVVLTFALCLLVITGFISTKLGSEFAHSSVKGLLRYNSYVQSTGLEESLRIQRRRKLGFF